MSKVFIFKNSDMDDMEFDINKFLEDKTLIDIKISTTVAKDLLSASDKTWLTAVVIYEDAEHNPLKHPESYLDDTMAIVDDMTTAQRVELLKYLENSIERNRGAT